MYDETYGVIYEVIAVDNKASLVLYIYSTHAVCHAATNPMFRSCMTLSISSFVIENCHYRGRESAPSL